MNNFFVGNEYINVDAEVGAEEWSKAIKETDNNLAVRVIEDATEINLNDAYTDRSLRRV